MRSATPGRRSFGKRHGDHLRQTIKPTVGLNRDSWIRNAKWMDNVSLLITTFIGCLNAGQQESKQSILLGSLCCTFGGGFMMKSVISITQRRIPSLPFSWDSRMDQIIWFSTVLLFYYGFTHDELTSFIGTKCYNFLKCINMGILVSFGTHICYTCQPTHWLFFPFLVYLFAFGGGDLQNSITHGVYDGTRCAWNDQRVLMFHVGAVIACLITERHFYGKSSIPVFIAAIIIIIRTYGEELQLYFATVQIHKKVMDYAEL